jgi:hypothetical protein
MMEDRVKIAVSIWGQCLYENPLGKDWLFPKYLEEAGFELVSLDDSSAKFYAALDYSKPALKRIKRLSARQKVLVAFEPKAVNPSQHTKSTRNKFGAVYVMSPDQCIRSSDRVIQLGPFADLKKVLGLLTENAGKPRLAEVVILNENKFSFVPKNNYKMRYLAIRELAEAGWNVNVGGKNWQQGFLWQLKEQVITLLVNLKSGSKVDLRMYHGPLRSAPNIKFWGRVDDGLEFLSRFDFALAIENDSQYLSEKLLNAIAAGCVPIYVGASLDNFGIPADVALRVAGEPGEFEKSLRNLGTDAVDRIRAAGRKWLLEPGVLEYWSHEQALRNIVEVIKHHAKNN